MPEVLLVCFLTKRGNIALFQMYFLFYRSFKCKTFDCQQLERRGWACGCLQHCCKSCIAIYLTVHIIFTQRSILKIFFLWDIACVSCRVGAPNLGAILLNTSILSLIFDLQTFAVCLFRSPPISWLVAFNKGHQSHKVWIILITLTTPAGKKKI